LRHKQPALDFSGKATTTAETKQEQGIAILDKCGIIHLLVDLMDGYGNFGVILSLETLPRSRNIDQFSHVSADLARFATMTLQTFPQEDAQQILLQPPEVFGQNWAETINCHITIISFYLYICRRKLDRLKLRNTTS
jgi:hypothetical protein